MSGDPEPIFDLTEGDWRFTAKRGDNGDATVQVTLGGKPFRTFTYPAYRVWNIAAHMVDIIADFKGGMQLADWPNGGSA